MQCNQGSKCLRPRWATRLDPGCLAGSDGTNRGVKRNEDVGGLVVPSLQMHLTLPRFDGARASRCAQHRAAL